MFRGSVSGAAASDVAAPVINAPATARDRLTNERRSQRMMNSPPQQSGKARHRGVLLKVRPSWPISRVRHKGPLPMSLSIHTTPPAAPAADLAPAPAVKSTLDTTSAAPSQKQASSQAAVTQSAPKDTVQISTAAQAALQESRETPAQTAKEAAHSDRQAVTSLAKQTAGK